MAALKIFCPVLSFLLSKFFHCSNNWMTNRINKQEILHVLTIANREVNVACLHSQFDSQMLILSNITFKKGENFGVVWGFLHFIFWKKYLWTLFMLHNKGITIFVFQELLYEFRMKCGFFSTNSVFPQDKSRQESF